MKRFDAIIRPEKLQAVIKSLRQVGVSGFTVVPVQGRGQQKNTHGESIVDTRTILTCTRKSNWRLSSPMTIFNQPSRPLLHPHKREKWEKWEKWEMEKSLSTTFWKRTTFGRGL